MNGSVLIRPMAQPDLEAADRAHRLAFGTFFGLPDPLRFRGDAEVVRTRWATDPAACLVAESDGRVIGSGLGMDWGSVFVVGPVTVLPELQGRGIARQLMDGLMALVQARPGITLAGLFTHPQSNKHIRLYESYGFMPQSLIGVFSKPVAASAADPGPLYSRLSAAQQEKALADCRAVAAANYPGLDLTREIRAVAAQKLGDMLLLTDGGRITGFAICHVGAGSEAGSGRCFVKFAAVRPGAAEDFTRLVDRCEALAASLGAERIIAGVNSGRRAAYKMLQARGYRADLNGLAMHRPDAPGIDRADLFVVDDWR
jgi:ribosomal protein S18 acetylase RimI-like enzyme